MIMNHQDANARTVMPATPPMTPPTITPVLEGEDRGVAVVKLETKDVDVAGSADGALALGDVADKDGVDGTLGFCDVTDTVVDPDETSVPLTMNLPSFLAQQLRPPVPPLKTGSPQQRLPSAQIVRP